MKNDLTTSSRSPALFASPDCALTRVWNLCNQLRRVPGRAIAVRDADLIDLCALRRLHTSYRSTAVCARPRAAVVIKFQMRAPCGRARIWDTVGGRERLPNERCVQPRRQVLNRARIREMLTRLAYNYGSVGVSG
jgi:hypothetical protein